MMSVLTWKDVSSKTSSRHAIVVLSSFYFVEGPRYWILLGRVLKTGRGKHECGVCVPADRWVGSERAPLPKGSFSL